MDILLLWFLYAGDSAETIGKSWATYIHPHKNLPYLWVQNKLNQAHVSSPCNECAQYNHTETFQMKNSHPQSQHKLYLLLDMVSFEAALARPLTPAVRAGSMLLLLDCALNLPHVFGFKLARKEDLGDWVVVGLLAIKRKELYSNHFNKTKGKKINKIFTDLI